MTTACKKEIFYGRTPESVPLVCLGTFEEEVYSSYTGPDTGLCSLHPNEDVDAEIAGIKGWRKKDQKAYGICISLYDQHPVNGKMSGDPIADAFAICARKNNAVLLIADGVNWGEKSRLAARCALYGCMTYINNQLFTLDRQPNNTQEALKILRDSLDSAHNTILDKGGGLTTICACLVCPVFKSSNYAMCCVNVGDSYAYVLSKNLGIREVTIGSHDVTSERDIRDAQGALGPVDGQNAELQNLTCSLTFCSPEDIVFLTTDGISDNFDPVVTKVALPLIAKVINETPSGSHRQLGRSASCSERRDDAKPEMRPDERHIYAMKEMERVVHEFELVTEESCSAQELCSAMVQHVLKLTDTKRKVLENPQLYVRRKLTPNDRKRRDSEIVEKMTKAPGKLDHASIVALELGGWLYEGKENVTLTNETTTADNDTLASTTTDIGSSIPNRGKSPKTQKPKRSLFSPKLKHSNSDSPSKSHKNTPISLPIKNYFRRSGDTTQSKSQPSTPTAAWSPPFIDRPNAVQSNAAHSSVFQRRSLKKDPMALVNRRSVSYESSV